VNTISACKVDVVPLCMISCVTDQVA